MNIDRIRQSMLKQAALPQFNLLKSRPEKVDHSRVYTHINQLPKSEGIPKVEDQPLGSPIGKTLGSSIEGFGHKVLQVAEWR